MHDTVFEPQLNSSFSNLSNESFEIDFHSISISLELDQSDDSFQDFFFEKETDMSSFFTSLTESTKDESEDLFHSSQSISRHISPITLVCNPISNQSNNIANTTPLKPTIIHKPTPVRRNRGLYCKSMK